MNDIKADSSAIQKYWLGKKIKHLDSEPYLGTPMYMLLHVKDVAKKTLKTESDFPVSALKHLGKFLRKCKYVSDRDLFDKTDYWQLPDQFEKNRRGDCEDFSLWSWRKFLDLGEDARFTYGRQDGGEHAWVTIFREGLPYIFEATAKPSWFGKIKIIPAEQAVRYKPIVSIDNKLQFYKHTR